MRYPQLMMAALATAVFLTGCGRVSPTASAGPVIDTRTAGASKLTNVTPRVAGGGLVAAGVGSVKGRVIDASGRGLAGAIVAVDPSGARVTTDATGSFRMTGVSSGMYTFKAMLSGMQQMTTNGVVVEANAEAQVPDISMVPGSGPSGITSISYVQQGELGRVGDPPATLIAPLGVAVRGRDVMVLDVNHSAGVKTGIVRAYDGQGGKFVGKYGDYSKWLGLSQMKDTVKAIALDLQSRALVLDGNKHMWRWNANGGKDKDFDIDVENGNDVAVSDKDGSIYVAHAGGVTKYGPDGDGGTAVGELNNVEAVALYKGTLWTVSGNKVQQLGADGSMVMEFGPAGADDKTSAFSEATDVAVDPRNGNLVVVDKGAKNVYVYDSVGTLIGKVGQGVFESPVAATVDANGMVYVVDGAKKKVYEFLPAGMH